MAFKTYEARALEYEAAITAIIAGTVSSYSIAGRTFTKHDLNTLEALYKYYRAKAEESTRGNVTYANMRVGHTGGV